MSMYEGSVKRMLADTLQFHPVSGLSPPRTSTNTSAFSIAPLSMTEKVDHVPRWFWQRIDNRKHFLHSLARIFGICNEADWYDVSVSDVLRVRGGRGFLLCYKGSLQRALGELVPEYGWVNWRFVHSRRSPYRKLEYLEWLFGQSSVPRCWFKAFLRPRFLATTSARQPHCLLPASRDFQRLLSAAAQGLVPSWVFRSVERGFWNKEANRRAYLKWLTNTLEITTTDELRSVSRKLLQVNGGAGLLARNRGLLTIKT